MTIENTVAVSSFSVIVKCDLKYKHSISKMDKHSHDLFIDPLITQIGKR